MSDESTTPRKFLSNRQSAERHGVCTRTVDRWSAEGRLPKPYRFGPRIKRWASDEVEECERRALTGTAA
jgi:predicted DNA-binding transcriptional regulator AlpA